MWVDSYRKHTKKAGLITGKSGNHILLITFVNCFGGVTTFVCVALMYLGGGKHTSVSKVDGSVGEMVGCVCMVAGLF